jgi:hypothetical protein
VLNESLRVKEICTGVGVAVERKPARQRLLPCAWTPAGYRLTGYGKRVFGGLANISKASGGFAALPRTPPAHTDTPQIHSEPRSLQTKNPLEERGL